MPLNTQIKPTSAGLGGRQVRNPIFLLAGKTLQSAALHWPHYIRSALHNYLIYLFKKYQKLSYNALLTPEQQHKRKLSR
jgi:hypothetical protein